jgi:hypothetical protein
VAVRQLWRVLFHLAAAAAVSVAAGCRVVSFSLASLLTESIQYINSFESAVSQMLMNLIAGRCVVLCRMHDE